MSQGTEYPTEEQLKTIREWPYEKAGELPAYVASCWHWEDRARETSPGLWAFSTGGWSGNEELLDEMRRSKAWLVGRLGWNSLYVPGGLLVVAVTKEAEARMDAMQSRITEWAWKGE